MEEKKIDILLVQETKINHNSTESRKGFTWYFSTDVKDADRDKVSKLRNANKKVPATLNEKTREHRGVGIIFNKKVEKYVKQVTAHDGNNITAHVEGPTTLVIHNTYQPHA
eukprot:12087378-Karenia_brevis.AAC.1